LAELSQSRQKSTVVLSALNASAWLAGTWSPPQDSATKADWPAVPAPAACRPDHPDGMMPGQLQAVTVTIND
jgi:hypothetical protein